MAKSKIGKSLGESFGKLPPLVQWLIVIVTLVILYIFISSLIKKVGRKATNIATIQDLKSEQDIWAKEKGEQLSYPLSQYTQIANSLYYAMAGIGTYDDVVFEQFKKLNNNLDFLELKKVFGLKDGYTLEEWIHGDLDSIEISNVNKILADRGIQYSF